MAHQLGAPVPPSIRTVGRLVAPGDLEPFPLERAREYQPQLADVVGLADEIVGTGADRFARGARVAEGGEHDDDRVRITLAHHAQEIEPARPGHPQVGKYRVEGAFASQLRESFRSGEGATIW